MERSRWPEAEKTGGRQRGAPNRATADAKAACAALIDDPEYRRGLAERLNAGKLAPALECMLWYYAKGRPHEVVGVDAEQHITVSWLDSSSTA